MPEFSAANIIGNLLFSGLGYIAYSYGKKMDKTRVMYPGRRPDGLFVFRSRHGLVGAIGTALTGWVWATRNDG